MAISMAKIVTPFYERFLLGVVLLALTVGVVLAVYAVGHYRGSSEGKATAALEHKAQTLDAVQTMLVQYAQLISAAQEVSDTLRTAAAQRQETNTQTTQELRDALKQTAASRTGCRLDAASLQHLQAAASRAAAATTPARTGRSAGAVPTTPRTAER